jgi:hypothetical protein
VKPREILGFYLSGVVARPPENFGDLQKKMIFIVAQIG